MTQENKELLLKDLCGRIMYGVKCTVYEDTNVHTLSGVLPNKVYNELYFEELDLKECDGFADIQYCKPYLFPLSSITIEQEKELSKFGVSYGEYALHDDIRGLGIMVDEAYIFFEFCYKYHIDFLGLIEMGLAINATDKNVY